MFISLFSFGQEVSNDSIFYVIYNQISQQEAYNRCEISKNNNTIAWIMKDTIYFEPGCCGPSISPWDLEKIDTVKLAIRFESGWNKERIDSIKKTNIEIVDILTNEAIKYCDSINWHIKINKKSFLEYPYKTLKDYWRFRKKGKYDIANDVRLPDTTINDIGIFIDLSFNYEWFTIYQERPRQILLSQIEFISFEILRKKKLITGRFEYK